MHEMGIVFHLAKTLDELSKEQNIQKIGSVSLKVGEVSGIVTDLFEDCWDYYKKKFPVLEGSKLYLKNGPAVTYCTACGKTYETVRYGKTCPHCGSAETYLTEGNSVIIESIEAETDDDRQGEMTAEMSPLQVPGK